MGFGGGAVTFIPGQTVVTYDKSPEDDWMLEEKPCRHCGVVGQWFWRLRNSSDGGYQDEENHCRACGKRWWVDGSDS